MAGTLDLSSEGQKTPAGGEADYAKLVRECAGDVQRLKADGTRGAKYDKAFHSAPPYYKIVYQRQVEDYGVEAVEDSAVTRQQPAGLLDVRESLELGLEEVSGLADDCHQGSEYGDERQVCVDIEGPRRNERRQNRGCESSDCALPCLVWADGGR